RLSADGRARAQGRGARTVNRARPAGRPSATLRTSRDVHGQFPVLQTGTALGPAFTGRASIWKARTFEPRIGDIRPYPDRVHRRAEGVVKDVGHEDHSNTVGR